MGLKVTGFPELQAALMRVVSATEAESTNLIRDEVRRVKADAQERAPRKTGELEGGIVGRALGKEGEVESTTRHSIFVEGGTYKDEAQPFMAPAAEASRSRFPRIAAARLGAAARSASGRG